MKEATADPIHGSLYFYSPYVGHSSGKEDSVVKPADTEFMLPIFTFKLRWKGSRGHDKKCYEKKSTL